MLLKKEAEKLPTISSAIVNQNWFHKNYSKLVTQDLLQIEQQTLVKISFTNVTPNRPKNGIQKWFHNCYSKLVS